MPTELQIKVLTLLKSAGLPPETNDAVLYLVEGGERGQVPCDCCGQLVDQEADTCRHCG